MDRSLYNPLIKCIIRKDIVWIPDISVIIVAHKVKKELFDNLDMFAKQLEVSYEVILVNNGMIIPFQTRITDVVDTYIKLKQNTGAYLSRNVGAMFALGKMLVFVDDDGVPYNGYYLKAFKDAFDKYDIICARGRCIAPSGIKPDFYDWGDKPFPSYPILEGNSAFDRLIFFSIGGWNDDIKFGGGGLDISCRLLREFPEYHKQMYCPDAILVHEYARDEKALAKKRERQKQGRTVWEKAHPFWKRISQRWRGYCMKTDALRLKTNNREPVLGSGKHIDLSLDNRIKQALKGMEYKFHSGRILVIGSENHIVDKMEEYGFVGYLKKVTIPKIIEFRYGKEKVEVEIRPRR
jgi:glycosyltransferase involved in cell wall biosynthesis